MKDGWKLVLIVEGRGIRHDDSWYFDGLEIPASEPEFPYLSPIT